LDRYTDQDQEGDGMTCEQHRSPIQALRDYLVSTSVGAVDEPTELATLLADCWDAFEGSRDEGMAPYKLRGRMERVVWEPPVLRFQIERHGGTALGSTRAERHEWQLNLDSRTATCVSVGYRQIRPMAPRLDIRSLADEVVRLILMRAADTRLKWRADGSVQVLLGKVLPQEGFKRTLEGRNKRFHAALDERMEAAGWRRVGKRSYAPPAVQESVSTGDLLSDVVTPRLPLGTVVWVEAYRQATCCQML
jgi:hypothetical protein